MVRAATLFSTGAFLLAASIVDAGAQSLRELRSQDAEETALAGEARYTSSFCRMPLDVRIDWRASAGWPADASLAAACDGALGALEWVCRTAEGRARAARVNQFVCAGDGAGPSLNGSILRYGAEPGANGFSETKSLLESEL